jgi:FkbM family methyltransferase
MMNPLGVLNEVKYYRKVYVNYIEVMRKLYNGEREVEVELRGGGKENIARNLAMLLPYIPSQMMSDIQLERTLELLKNGKIPYNDHILHFEGFPGNGDIAGVFFKEEYSDLNVKRETVLDVGANIGDSAIYFAICGAIKVYALEPYPFSFSLLERNIKENNFQEIVNVLNAGYGKDGAVMLDPAEKTYGGSWLSPKERGIEVNIYSMDTILRRICPSCSILKMDCEGCEYNLLNEDNDVLRNFKRMQIEFHGKPHEIVSKLKNAGFKAHLSYHPAVKTLGFIYAEL